MEGRGTEASPRQEDPARREGHMSQRSEDGGSFCPSPEDRELAGSICLKTQRDKDGRPNMSEQPKNCHLGSRDFRRKMVPEAYSR